MPFVELLRLAAANAVQRPADEWYAKLQNLQGRTGVDGVERLTTQRVFDALSLSQPQRTPGAARRVSQIMQSLGWSPVRVFGLNQHGTKEQVRGYARLVQS